MLAVPAGNLPLIVAQQNDLDTEELAKGIILSTVLSAVTIPMVHQSQVRSMNIVSFLGVVLSPSSALVTVNS